MKLNLCNQEPNIEYIFNEKKMYHPSSCAGRGMPKVKDRIVTTFSLPCTTHPVVLDEERPG
jgi:hypothetical protein